MGGHTDGEDGSVADTLGAPARGGVVGIGAPLAARGPEEVDRSHRVTHLVRTVHLISGHGDVGQSQRGGGKSGETHGGYETYCTTVAMEDLTIKRSAAGLHRGVCWTETRPYIEMAAGGY